MTKPEKIPIEKYDYPLPAQRIAKYPLADRDASKILVYRPGGNGKKSVYQDSESREQKQFTEFPEQPEKKHLPQDPGPIVQKPLQQEPEFPGQKPDSRAPELIEEKAFSQVPELLEKGDRLFFNATRVVQARLIFWKSTGARIEIFCLEPFLPADHQLAFSSTDPVEFVCLIGNSKKWKEGALTKNLGEQKISGEGKVIEEIRTTEDRKDKDTGAVILTAEISGRQDDKFIVRFSWNSPGTSFGEILERSGSTPIPPYLNREAEEQDAATYQTVYARQDGSVAAPTAGLHFTDRVLDALNRKGVRRHELILHVGAGTFIPVKEKNAVDHHMHAELVTADRPLLESLLAGDRNIAVGTTTTRSLESIYWLGVKAISNTLFTFENLCLDQWDAYAMEDEVPLEQAVKALLKKMDDAGMESFSFHTRMMITPGYRFRVIGGLFTNFHQPKSTLLLLIAAVAGDDWRKIYDFALENEFRFLSYGDSSLLFLQQADYNLIGNPNSFTNGIEVNNDL